MGIKDVKLRKGMSRDEVNKLLRDNDIELELVEDEYLGNKYNHNWKCSCCNIFVRAWRDISSYNSIACKDCIKLKQEQRYKYEVEKDGEYEYIRSYRNGDILPNGRIVKGDIYIQIKHKYCGSVYGISAGAFINTGNRCSNCCKKYENSLAHYIEVELGESLGKYWDFDKNTINPSTIWKSGTEKVWIKCQNNHQDSYEITCNHFYNGRRCPYCASKKVHPKDSFGQWLKDNDLFHLWSSKNKIDPFTIAKQHNGKIWMICDKVDYHNDYDGYDTYPHLFINGGRCSYCYNRKVHPKDSFAQYHIDNTDPNFLDKYWSDKNIISPWGISPSTHDKVWIKCQEIDYHNDEGGYIIQCNSFTKGTKCPYCHSIKVHSNDSFAAYHIENTDPQFLEKYWDYDKNTVSPWEISPSSTTKVWIKCQSKEINELNGVMKKEYHGSYEISCDDFTRGRRCPYCNPRGNSKIHPYDSFGYHNFDKVLSWYLNNKVSPFRVSKASGKKYKFICEECGHVWESTLGGISQGSWCPECAASKGEKKVISWMNENNITYIYDEPYFNDLTGIGGNPLRPDFILPEHKIWIEYDGEFHYKDFYKDGSYETLKIHDKYKDKYANEHGWKMIRIKYTKFNEIEEILEKELKEIK